MAEQRLGIFNFQPIWEARWDLWRKGTAETATLVVSQPSAIYGCGYLGVGGGHSTGSSKLQRVCGSHVSSDV